MDTERISRLREGLLEAGRDSHFPPAGETDLEAVSRLERAAIERIEPMAELMYLMMMADGELEADELRILRGALHTLTDGLILSHTLDALLERFRLNCVHQGRELRLDSVTSLIVRDRDDAEMALMLVAAIAIADAHIDPTEHELFEQAREWLGISRRRARALLGEP